MSEDLQAQVEQLPTDPYLLLRVPRQADQDAIRRAYREASLQWHPDRTRNASERRLFAVAFHRIHTAYRLLADPTRRHAYDEDHPAPPLAPALALVTSDEVFNANQTAARFHRSMALLQQLPMLERQHNLAPGSLELDLPSADHEPPTQLLPTSSQDPAPPTLTRCTGVGCELVAVDATAEQPDGRNVCLCRTHARVHQCTSACTNRHAFCPLFAQCLHRHWQHDVALAWSLQRSDSDDPERPLHPYWFNARSGISQWCDAAASDAPEEQQCHPPTPESLAHTCSPEACGTTGFVRLQHQVWVCRRCPLNMHICTSTQCRQRQAILLPNQDEKAARRRIKQKGTEQLSAIEAAAADSENQGTFCWVTNRIYDGNNEPTITAEEEAVLARGDLPQLAKPNNVETEVVEYEGADGRRHQTVVVRENIFKRRGRAAGDRLHPEPLDAGPGFESAAEYIASLQEQQAQHRRDMELVEEQRLRQMEDECLTLPLASPTSASPESRPDTSAYHRTALDVPDPPEDEDTDEVVVAPTHAAASVPATDGAPTPKRVKREPSPNADDGATVAVRIQADGSAHAVSGVSSSSGPTLPATTCESNAPPPPPSNSGVTTSRIQRIARQFHQERLLADYRLLESDERLERVFKRHEEIMRAMDDAEARQEDEEEEDFYDRYVTAALDRPDFMANQLGDYEMLASMAGGGLEAVVDEAEEDQEIRDEIAWQEQELAAVERYERRLALMYTTNPALGEPAGTDEQGYALRRLNDHVYRVARPPRHPNTTRQRILDRAIHRARRQQELRSRYGVRSETRLKGAGVSSLVRRGPPRSNGTGPRTHFVGTVTPQVPLVVKNEPEEVDRSGPPSPKYCKVKAEPTS